MSKNKKSDSVEIYCIGLNYKTDPNGKFIQKKIIKTTDLKYAIKCAENVVNDYKLNGNYYDVHYIFMIEESYDKIKETYSKQ